MDRREFLIGGSAAALTLPLLSGCAAPAIAPPPPVPTAPAVAAGTGDAELNRIFEAIFQERVRTSPGLATFYGLDKGELAALRSQFDVRPTRQARVEEVARTNKFIGWIEAVPVAGLSPTAQLNREVILWDLRTGNIGPERFDIGNPQGPYVISQQDGAYFSTPDFLHSAHPIETASDAEAYLSRLAQFATLLDIDTDEQRRQFSRGYIAPGWALDLALGQMRKLRAPAPEASPMAASVADRAAAKGIAGDWRARAAKIIAAQVYPALDRQIAQVSALRPMVPAGDGVWRLDGGADIYAAALAEATTTNMSADEIHAVGLQQVAEITAQLDTILRSAGYTQGSVGERLTALNKDPRQLYPNTDPGRAQLLADLQADVAAIGQKMDRVVHNPPTNPLEIRRVPPEIQDGASNGYYRQATLDGSRPAIYFINLKNTEDWPKFSLPALTYHEGWPGHHLQLSLTQGAADMPMLRRTSFYSAYGEGWALYAETVADELGGYDGLERAGYLQSYLFRAERLVVDTGLHHKRWTREQAIDHMVGATGFARSRVQREIERYVASPGQATSYKIGHIAWVRAREKAEAALGARFDVRDFHDILREGPMPLTIFERRIDAMIARKQAA